MARIAIDAPAVSAAGKGHSRTQRESIRALAALGRHELVAFVRDPGVELGVPARTIRAPVALAWEQAGLARLGAQFDAVLTWTERLPLAARGRFVVWLFELPTHRIEQNRRSDASAYQRGSDALTARLWRRSLRRAAAVVAGSEATATEMRAEGIEVARVVYPGLSAGFEPGPGRAGDPYVLHLGSDDPRDNTATVLDAYARSDVAARLLVAGSARPVEQDGVEFLGRVSDEELVRLYQGAAAYLDATLYEGFGYQPLEAMACGAPVVASNASSIPEVVGDAGLLCDPRSPDELAASLALVLSEPDLASRLRQRGLERAREFTWERTAEGLAAVLDEVVA